MNLVIIPTFNRSFKLRRVLDVYASMKPDFKIVVLDASDDPKHQERNQAAADQNRKFVTRLATPNQEGVIPRLLNYLNASDEEFLAIGTDEDPFFPEYLSMAADFLSKHSDYSAAVGRYITFARPLLGLRRITFWTDSFVGIDVNGEDPALRIINLQRLCTGGAPPIYWSVRRKSAFVASMTLGNRIRFGSGQELLDQIVTCVQGKILISDMPMLFRDESRIKYVPYNNRDTGTHYIGEEDLEEIRKIAKEAWDPNVCTAVNAVTSWFTPRNNGESYASRSKGRVYCRFNESTEEQSIQSLRWLKGAIKWSCTLGDLLSQMFAYFYFLKLMSLKGKRHQFLKMSTAIPTNG